MSGSQVLRRVRIAVPIVVTSASLLSAVVVFLFVNRAIPSTSMQGHPTLHFDATMAALAIYVGVCALVLTGVMWRHTQPVAQWLRAERAPTDDEQERALRLALTIGKLIAGAWAGAALVTGAVEARENAHAGFDIAIATLLGGLTATALTTLLAERALRPVTARALVGGPPQRSAGPGVRSRLILAWALGTGAPLAGMGVAATVAFIGEYHGVGDFAEAMAFLIAAAAVAGVTCTWFAATHVGQRIAAVRHAMEDLRQGDLAARVVADDGGEVGMLQAGFNEMAAGLEERERLRDLFGRHVGEDVAREALRHGVALGGEAREVGVLFVDVIGSTAMAIESPPESVVAALNAFFAEVVDAAAAEDGWVNKFEGDGALCVFGAPRASADAAGQALAAARRLRDGLATRLPQMDAGIGVSAGIAVAGNVGADRRLEYTVIGDPVNEAARLCELAKTSPGRVLASGAAVQRAQASEAENWVARGAATLRGRREPTELAQPRP